ncbi:MAG: hypothetical protein ACYDH5_20090 [Acidimicrobiales bacterium]
MAELVGTGEERAHAEELAHLAASSPAMARLREVVAFIARGRRATSSGNLPAADAKALATRIGATEDLSYAARSMADLPATAHAFRWALASRFLAWQGTKILPGPRALDLGRDPLSAWFSAATTLLDNGLLDGFRQGWRKSYVELLDANAPGMIAAVLDAGGVLPLAAIEDLAWKKVAASYGYELDDADERRHVTRLVQGMVATLADLGAVTRRGDEVALTGLGYALASITEM